MKLPNFSFEKRLWKKGFKVVAGVDEVGRGCFAGPVVAGCVVFDKGILSSKRIKKGAIRAGPFSFGTFPRIDDSKKMTPRQREAAETWIKKNALTWGIGKASAVIIDSIGIGKATKLAFRSAVSAANKRLAKKRKIGSNTKYPVSSIEYLLLDAFYVPFIRGLPRQKGSRMKGVRKKKDALLLMESKARQLAVINGDEKSFSIAAASIIAKVYRDRLMETIGLRRKYKKYGWFRNKGYLTTDHKRAILKYGITYYHRKSFVNTFLSKI